MSDITAEALVRGSSLGLGSRSPCVLVPHAHPVGVIVMVSIVADQSDTSLPELAQWVAGIAELAKPDAVVWCDGSQAEWDRLTRLLVTGGTFTRLNPELRPNSFYCASDPSDVARVEDRTFICSAREEAAGPPTTWPDPAEMRPPFGTLSTGRRRRRGRYP